MTLADRPCPRCNFDRPRRMPRETWLARRIMHYFGCYPWECPMCRIRFYRKNRLERVERLRLPSSDFGSQELSR